MNTLYIVHCASWEPKAPFDDSLPGFPSKEDAEVFAKAADRICSSTHTVVTVVPEV